MADRDTEPEDAWQDDGRTSGDAPWDTAPADGDPPLPADVVTRAVTLTRRLRQADDDDERAAVSAERDRLLADHGYVARVREDAAGETLVLYPDEWVDDGVVGVDRIEDTGRAVERSLSGVGSDDWGDVAAHNRRIADRVADVHGDPHGATAHAYADFMSNHYAKRIEAASPAERREFREEYLPRNGWPTEAQREAVEESLRRIEETAETE
jgi:hypothetical protein